tara:strand:- start:136 stop:375 length:240 start_codon:yes stop_codon:yes gene_type:complete
MCIQGGNNMDVTLVARLLHHLGHTPEIVTSFPRSMRLASSAPYNGPTFILNTGDHYVTYALRKGTWWVCVLCPVENSTF